MNLSQNCRLLSIRYKCRMIRLTDEQWERIRNHFPEEHIPDGRPGRKPIATRHVLCTQRQVSAHSEFYRSLQYCHNVLPPTVAYAFACCVRAVGGHATVSSPMSVTNAPFHS